MSYNKLKSLVANVEAIKTALQIHIQGRQATPEEKETLSQYSGFGGIKEVLNIGTDKPVSGDMEEPIRRLQELIDTYPYFTEAMKASVLTAFYTPKFLIDVVAKQIHATFKDNELQMRSFLEPSAGIGGFLPVAMSDTCGYAIEKDPVSGLILSLLNDNTVTRTAGFETIDEQGFEHTKFDVIASNIPFGNFRVFDAELWKKGGIYEQATKTIHNYFFVKALELLNEGGLLAFVTSRGVADTPSNKFVREYLVNHADLISAIRMPDTLFMYTSGIEGRQRFTDLPKAYSQGGTLAEGTALFTGRQGKGRHDRRNDRIRQQTFHITENHPRHRQPHCDEPVRQVCTQIPVAG